jgi:adenylylsulfate kinase
MKQSKSTNVTWQTGAVTRADRAKILGHRGATVWFTGLSASGKSTLAKLVEHRLCERGRLTYVLDGDNMRHGLNGDLGFSEADRKENVRRFGEVARLFTDAGVIVICALISPYRADRDRVRELIGEGDFIEVYLRASLQTCEQRDPKGLYRKARAGQIPDFTGISAPYEEPLQPELLVDTERNDPEQCMKVLIEFLERTGHISNSLRPPSR